MGKSHVVMMLVEEADAARKLRGAVGMVSFVMTGDGTAMADGPKPSELNADTRALYVTPASNVSHSKPVVTLRQPMW